MSDYAKGFKDGFAAGLEEGKKLTPVKSKAPTRLSDLNDYVFGQPGYRPGYLGLPNTCQVCGRLQEGMTGYVCYSPNCPSIATAYSIGPTGGTMAGAVGSQNEYDSRGWRIK